MKTSLLNFRISVYLLIALSLLVISISPSYAKLPVVIDGNGFESPFTKVFEKVSPCVVRIEVKSEVDKHPQQQIPWFFWQQRPQQGLRPYKGMGSGVIVDREGHILTNNHVIESPNKEVVDKITVIINDDDEYRAEVVGRDPQTDLAVIKLDLDGKLLPPENIAEMGDSDTIKPGDYAIAIGNPLGLERTITVGVISAVGRDIINPYGADQLRYKNFIQTDAQINPGNSGGALADINGRVIGINDIYTQDYAGIGFAIPINLAKGVMRQLIASGVVKRGFVGLKGKDITNDIREAMELPSKEGVIIEEIESGYPAEKAGLKHGDIIVSINGRKIKNFNDFRFKIAEHKPGETIKLEILSDGKTKTINLKLSDLDDYLEQLADSSNSASWRGIYVVDINSSQAGKFELGDIESGAVISKIDSESPAAETALEVGDVIVEINNKSIENVGDFIEIRDLYKDKKKPILIYRLRRKPNGQIIKGFVAVKYE